MAVTLDLLVLTVFLIVYCGMFLGELPGLALDRTGVALLGAIAILACEIDPALPAMMRRKIPVLGHVRDFSIRVEGVSVQAGEAAA